MLENFILVSTLGVTMNGNDLVGWYGKPRWPSYCERLWVVWP